MNGDKLKLMLAMAVFGTIGLVRRFIPCSSGVIAFARGFIGVLFLLLVRLIKKQPFPVAALKKNLVPLSISGILIGGNWIFLFEAYRFTTVSVATVCYYMAPVFIILASPLLLKERLTLKKGVCAAAAVCGMVLVSGVLETGLTGLTGVLFGLGAAVMYAAVILINKKIDGLNGNDRTVFQLGVAAIVLLPYVLITEDFSALRIDAFAAVMLLVAGVVHTGLTYAMYFDSIRSVPAQTVALFSYIDPAVAILLSAFVLKEGISLPAVIGVVLVIGSTMISELNLEKKRS